jgi:hypothetical protein
LSGTLGGAVLAVGVGDGLGTEHDVRGHDSGSIAGFAAPQQGQSPARYALKNAAASPASRVRSGPVATSIRGALPRKSRGCCQGRLPRRTRPCSRSRRRAGPPFPAGYRRRTVLPRSPALGRLLGGRLPLAAVYSVDRSRCFSRTYGWGKWCQIGKPATRRVYCSPFSGCQIGYFYRVRD